MRGNRRSFPRHFRALRWAPLPYSNNVKKSLTPLREHVQAAMRQALLWCCALVVPAAWAQADAGFFVFDAQIQQQVRGFVLANRPAQPANEGRTEITLGALDARLRLAPCAKVQVHLPFGSKPWGKTRVGLRCVEGSKAWNVYLPVTVSVYGRAWVAAAALPAQHVIAQEDLREAEIDLAADNSPALTAQGASPLGRTLAQPLLAGAALRDGHLRVRQWFAAGDMVQIRAAGSGFAIAGAGEAITAGLEGRPARVRTEGGRVVSGKPVAERMLEISL